MYGKLNGKGTTDLSHLYHVIKLNPLTTRINNLTSMLMGSIGIASSKKDAKVSPSPWRPLLPEIAEIIQNLYPLADFVVDDYVEEANIQLQGIHCYLSEFDYPDKHSSLSVLAMLNWALISVFHHAASENDWLQFIGILSASLIQENREIQLDTSTVIQILTLLANISTMISGLSLELSVLTDFWFSNDFCRSFLFSHKHEGVSWFNQERFELLFEITCGSILVKNIRDCASCSDVISSYRSKVVQLSADFYSALNDSVFQEERFKIAVFK